MSSFYDVDGNVFLDFPFPGEKFDAILEKLSYPTDTDFRRAPFEQKRMVFLASFREFLNGYLLLEELSEISNHIKAFFDFNTATSEQQEYEMMIYTASDLSLEIRSKEKSNAGYMETLWEYFEKYKYLLNDISDKFPVAEYFESPRTFKAGEEVDISKMLKIVRQKQKEKRKIHDF